MRGNVLVVIALLASCKDKPAAELHSTGGSGSAAAPVVRTPGAAVKRGSLRRRPRAFFAVIAPAGADTSKLQGIAEAAAVKRGFGTANAVEGGLPTMIIKKMRPDEVGWRRADAPYLGSHFPPGDVDAIDKATYALSMGSDWRGTGFGGLHDAGTIAIEVATACHGWIMDVDTHLLFTPETLADHLPTPKTADARKVISVHGVAGGEDLAFLDTAGMGRLGLPELYVAGVPQSRVSTLTQILNATAQTLIEQGDLARDGVLDVDLSKLPGDWHAAELKKDGGTGTITWLARWSRGDAAPDEKLDPDDLVLELSIAGAKPGTAEALVGAAERYLGALPDKARALPYEDELKAAGVKARDALTALRPHFKTGVPPKEQLGVKAPFTTDDGEGIEWMWVDVVAFKGDVLDGTLDNDPERVSRLKLGQRVKVKFSEIADFIFVRADGTKVGGFSLDVLRAHGEDVPPL